MPSLLSTDSGNRAPEDKRSDSGEASADPNEDEEEIVEEIIEEVIVEESEESESEYEEIEEEIEEEVEEEEEGHGGEDSSELPNGIMNKRDDASVDMECDNIGKGMQFGSFTPGKPESIQRPNCTSVDERNDNSKISGTLVEQLAIAKEGSSVNTYDCESLNSRICLGASEVNEAQKSTVDKRSAAGHWNCTTATISKSDSTSNIGPSSNKIIGSDTMNESNVAATEVAISAPTGKKLPGTPHHLEEIKQVEVRTRNDRRRVSRDASNDTASTFAGTEINDGSKRAAIICDFYARGWCIRGNSCRFLHIKENDKNTLKKTEEVGAASDKEVVQQSEGMRGHIEREKSSNPGRMGSSVGKSPSYSCHISSGSILPLDHEKGNVSFLRNGDSLLNITPAPLKISTREDPGLASSFKNIGRESLRDDYMCPDNYKSHVFLLNRVSPITKNSLPLEHGSSISGSLSDLSNYHSGQTFHETRKLDELPNRRSQFLHSDCTSLDVVRTTVAATDLPCSTEQQVKISSYDWEPSIPFKPSHLISSLGVLSTGTPYDPFCDIAVLPSVKDGSHSSVYCQGASILNALDGQIIREPANTQTRGTEGSADKLSAASHDRLQGRVMEKKDYVHRVDLLEAGADMEGNSVVDGQSGIVPKEEKLLEIAESDDANHQSSGLKMGKDRQKYRKGDKHVSNTNLQKGNRALEYFRAALLDNVKELLKPNWREGTLTRDAHKIIVKKAVDKIIGTMQPKEVPASSESIERYFSSFETKIAKLVEGYVIKYGKL